MMLAKTLTTLACGALLLVGTALAKPPTEEELPRLPDVVDGIQKDLEEAERAEAEAARDVDQEFLDHYAAERIGATEDHRRVVEIMDDRSLERRKPGIREKAAKILATRWPDGRARTLRVKMILTKYLIPLLGQRGHDEKSNRLGIVVLKAMWDRDHGYKLDTSWRDKNKAIKRWREFLKR